MDFKNINTKHRIEAVIFDWAGTTVDYGCFAPLEVFLSVFKQRGVDVTLEEARGPMGMLKIDHIRELTKIPRIAEEWTKLHGRMPDESDVAELYSNFEPALLDILAEYAEPIPGVIDTVKTLREMGIKIGSTTGYTAKMMSIVVPEAEKRGYKPDSVVTPDDVSAGRPAPWMCYKNAENLGVFPMSAIVKVGDTAADIKEGVNAGCWSVGVVEGSSELGLKLSEAKMKTNEEFEMLCKAAEARFYRAGAHCVIRTINQLPALINEINGRD